MGDRWTPLPLGEEVKFDYVPDVFRSQHAESEAEADGWYDDPANNRRPPELLPRDEVARAINNEVKEGRGSPHGGVFLDVSTRLPAEEIRRRLPSMHHQFKELADVDITTEPMEVGPTCHYVMGGVRVDADTAASDVPGLFAAGEVAGGMHGSNRLGGNSLSDLLVFGRRAGMGAAAYIDSSAETDASPGVVDQAVAESIRSSLAPLKQGDGENPYTLHSELQDTMNDLVGIIRKGPEMEKALERLSELTERVQVLSAPGDRVYNPGWHLALALPNMLLVSEAVTKAALERTESRGGHTRDDFPDMSAEWRRVNLAARAVDGRVEHPASARRRPRRTAAPVRAGGVGEVPHRGRAARGGVAREGAAWRGSAHRHGRGRGEDGHDRGGHVMTERTFRVWRGSDDGELTEYEVEVNEGEVVLDVLHRLQATQTPDMSVRWNCKAGKCGSCSVEINGMPRLSCMTRMSVFEEDEVVTVTPMRTFPIVRDLVCDVSYNYEKAREIPSFTPDPDTSPGDFRMRQVDVERPQEFRKCIECFLCNNVCHVIRDHEENKEHFSGPRYLMRVAELEMHPEDTADRRKIAQDEFGMGYCNITKCCTEVCPEGIRITDNALIPLKERVVDRKYDPLVWLGSKIGMRPEDTPIVPNVRGVEPREE